MKMRVMMYVYMVAQLERGHVTEQKPHQTARESEYLSVCHFVFWLPCDCKDRHTGLNMLGSKNKM